MSGPAVAAVVLAAGEGRRLRPLTDLRPKALCPVGNVALLDHALRRVAAVLGRPPDPRTVAVNAHHHAAAVVAHVGERAHLSVERPVALGTAGAIGRLAGWLAGRHVLVTNADAWLARDPTDLLAGWDGRRPRLLVVADAERPDFAGGWRFAGTSLLPAPVAAGLPAAPAGLYEAAWRDADLDLVATDATFVDCGTPVDYLRANLLASGGASVVGPGAVVEGEVVRSVVWPGARVGPGERLVECVRADGLTVAAPQPV